MDASIAEPAPFRGDPADLRTQLGVIGTARPAAHARPVHANGGAITVLIDQRNTGAPLIPFLGQPAQTAVALAELSVRAGAPLIPVRARRLEDGLSFDVKFEAPIAPGDPIEMMAEMNRRIEGWIDEDPGQWFWLHRRWKNNQRP